MKKFKTKFYIYLFVIYSLSYRAAYSDGLTEKAGKTGLYLGYFALLVVCIIMAILFLRIKSERAKEPGKSKISDKKKNKERTDYDH